jgi:hypothetical protein
VKWEEEEEYDVGGKEERQIANGVRAMQGQKLAEREGERVGTFEANISKFKHVFKWGDRVAIMIAGLCLQGRRVNGLVPINILRTTPTLTLVVSS